MHTAFIHRQARPVGFVECLLGGGNGSFDVIWLHVGHGGEFLPGPGIAGVKRVPIGGGHLLAANHGAVNFLGKKHLHLGKQRFTGSGLRGHDNEKFGSAETVEMPRNGQAIEKNHGKLVGFGVAFGGG